MWLCQNCYMHHTVANKMHGEKTTWKPHKNAACLEQILEATPRKTATVRQITSHLRNHSCKADKTYRTLLEAGTNS